MNMFTHMKEKNAFNQGQLIRLQAQQHWGANDYTQQLKQTATLRTSHADTKKPKTMEGFWEFYLRIRNNIRPSLGLFPVTTG